MVKRFSVLVLLFVAVYQVYAFPEVFTSVGKYDYGNGGVLFPDGETVLIEETGPGMINNFQFAADFDGYENVN